MNRFNFLRALVIVAGASFVLSALVATICVKIAGDVVGGVGLELGDLTTFGIAGLGATLVLGISGRALWRERASTGWAAYGVLLAILVVAGLGCGLAWGSSISSQHVAYVRGVAETTCSTFAAAHPTQSADCEARAIVCRAEVRAHPPVVARGLGGADDDDDEPSDPVEHAVWACLER